MIILILHTHYYGIVENRTVCGTTVVGFTVLALQLGVMSRSRSGGTGTLAPSAHPFDLRRSTHDRDKSSGGGYRDRGWTSGRPMALLGAYFARYRRRRCSATTDRRIFPPCASRPSDIVWITRGRVRLSFRPRRRRPAQRLSRLIEWMFFLFFIFFPDTPTEISFAILTVLFFCRLSL